MMTTEGPDDIGRYGVWARGVVRHVVAYERRKQRRARSEQPFDELEFGAPVESAANPEAQFDARICVGRIVGNLGEEQLELLCRRYVLEQSGTELAIDLASSPAGIRMRLMRLRSLVSELVGKSHGTFLPILILAPITTMLTC